MFSDPGRLVVHGWQISQTFRHAFQPLRKFLLECLALQSFALKPRNYPLRVTIVCVPNAVIDVLDVLLKTSFGARQLDERSTDPRRDVAEFGRRLSFTISFKLPSGSGFPVTPVRRTWSAASSEAVTLVNLTANRRIR
jgi:hypothetical protein